ncbi:MAG: FAD-dependent oxidoreductase [bacterium]|jgi:glycerol-3-phosphate dehydrogenase|nr:FAD-dependent oxidoreductase [bacterium]
MTQERRARIAVVGGGINGVMSAWALARAGHEVELFERGRLMGETSSASTKLIHGGLRYLEQGEFGLVRESLRERSWWLAQAPHLARPLGLILPIYRGVSRSRLLLRLGLLLYDLMAGRRTLGRHAWLSRAALVRRAPDLRPEGLQGGFLFYDVQMDDQGLGLWAADQARAAGATIHEGVPVERLAVDGSFLAGKERQADLIVNAAGPWCRDLLDRSGVPARHGLDLVRGSHLVLDRPLADGFFLQVPGEERICFALPWRGGTLLGTTEVRQGLAEPIACSGEEENYLLGVHASAFIQAARATEIRERFAGLRPLVDVGSANPGRTTREYVLEQEGRLLSVFGGKWTTARVLGEKVERMAGRIIATAGV